MRLWEASVIIGALKVPLPLPVITLIWAAVSTLAMSSFPSPLKSPVATERTEGQNWHPGTPDDWNVVGVGKDTGRVCAAAGKKASMSRATPRNPRGDCMVCLL